MALACATFVDRRFSRVLVYSTAFNFIIVLLNLDRPELGVMLFIFGCLLFPALLYYGIRSTEGSQQKLAAVPTVLGLGTIPVFYYFLLETVPYSHLFGYLMLMVSIMFMLLTRNMLKLVFLFDLMENSLLVLATILSPAAILGNFALEFLIEAATFLPLIMLVFLMVQAYKTNRRLSLW